LKSAEAHLWESPGGSPEALTEGREPLVLGIVKDGALRVEPIAHGERFALMK
jgi:hypothetical protein